MKNRKTRISSLLCTLLLSVSFILTGCNGGNPAVTTDGTTQATDMTTAPGTTAPETTPPTQPAIEEDGWITAFFGGGPLVTGLSGRTGYLDMIRHSGYDTVIVWSVHVHDDGSLWLNDVEVARDGEIVANKRYTENWNKIKGGDSTVNRVELSIGAWGCKDFEAIGALMKRDGTGRDTVLYKNFKALIDAYDADAINYDDESCYDVDILSNFGKMCEDMGVKVTLCPYTMMDMWMNVKKNLGDNVDRVYVQCYDGGAGNVSQLSTWKRAFNMDVIPGLWASRTDISTTEKFLSDNQKYITGCFFWLFDEMSSMKSPRSFADYATVVNDANKFAKSEEK